MARNLDSWKSDITASITNYIQTGHFSECNNQPATNVQNNIGKYHICPTPFIMAINEPSLKVPKHRMYKMLKTRPGSNKRFAFFSTNEIKAGCLRCNCQANTYPEIKTNNSNT